MADSSAKLPVASPGARMANGVCRLRGTNRCVTKLLGTLYSICVPSPHASWNSNVGEVCESVSCDSAVSVPSFLAPTFIFCSLCWRRLVLVNICCLVTVTCTGLPTIFAAITAMITWRSTFNLEPKPPPTYAATTLTSFFGIWKVSEIAIVASFTICWLAYAVTLPLSQLAITACSSIG